MAAICFQAGSADQASLSIPSTWIVCNSLRKRLEHNCFIFDNATDHSQTFFTLHDLSHSFPQLSKSYMLTEEKDLTSRNSASVRNSSLFPGSTFSGSWSMPDNREFSCLFKNFRSTCRENGVGVEGASPNNSLALLSVGHHLLQRHLLRIEVVKK